MLVDSYLTRRAIDIYASLKTHGFYFGYQFNHKTMYLKWVNMVHNSILENGEKKKKNATVGLRKGRIGWRMDRVGSCEKKTRKKNSNEGERDDLFFLLFFLFFPSSCFLDALFYPIFFPLSSPAHGQINFDHSFGFFFRRLLLSPTHIAFPHVCSLVVHNIRT